MKRNTIQVPFDQLRDRSSCVVESVTAMSMSKRGSEMRRARDSKVFARSIYERNPTKLLSLSFLFFDRLKHAIESLCHRRSSFERIFCLLSFFPSKNTATSLFRLSHSLHTLPHQLPNSPNHATSRFWPLVDWFTFSNPSITHTSPDLILSNLSSLLPLNFKHKHTRSTTRWRSR